MEEEHKKNKKSLRFYHIIIASCFLCLILMINSNHVNKERFLSKINQVKNGLYENIMSFRKLQGNHINYSQKVCSKASDDLNEYYQTGDLSKVGMDSDQITFEDKDKPYMKKLIAILQNINGDENGSVVDLGIDYGMRFIPFLIFLAFGLFGIFGWITCCICACCDCCCCCCCCKKPECKKVCFIFTYAFYAAVVGVSVYGLAVTNKAVKGLSDTGCTFLKFFDQILEGEIVQTTPPYWIGANGIIDLIKDIQRFITRYQTTSQNRVGQSFGELNHTKSVFLNKLEESSNYLYDDNNIATYSNSYSDFGTEELGDEERYILDIVDSYGKFDNDNGNFETGSIPFNWTIEFHLISDNAMRYLDIVNNCFDNILISKSGEILDKLDDGIRAINKIKQPIEDFEEDLGEMFDGLSKIGENYGKTSLHSIFLVLMSINITLAGFVFLICFFSMKQCTSCCCCRCIFKCITHLSWNILALMMISSFLFGSLLGILGIFGGDMMSLFSYILSLDNMNINNNKPLLIDKLDQNAKRYLIKFIHGDGDISSELNLGDSLASFNNISNLRQNITNLKNNFYNINLESLTYNETINKLNKEKDYENDIYLIKSHEFNQPSTKTISYHDYIEKINEIIKNNHKPYEWKFESNNEQCEIINDQTQFNPKKCQPIKLINSLGIDNEPDKQLLTKYAEILEDINTFVQNVNSENEDSFKTMLKNLSDYYEAYLLQFNSTLNTFDDIIAELMSEINQYIGDDGNFFSFLNGKFIKANIKIILKYLKDALGSNIYSIGVSLTIVGCSLMLSISSTLILLAIINEELKQHIKNENIPGQAAASSSQMKLNGVSPFQPKPIFH